MDVFVEQIVPIRKTPGQIGLVILMWIAALIISAALILVGLNSGLGMFAFLACGGLFYLAWRLTANMSVEYEYSVTNGFFDVDMIIAQRKRKRVLAAECKSIETFGKYDPARHQHTKYDKRIIAGNPAEGDCWYGTLRHKEMGHVLVVFQPEERVLLAMKKYLPKLVAGDAFRRGA